MCLKYNVGDQNLMLVRGQKGVGDSKNDGGGGDGCDGRMIKEG